MMLPKKSQGQPLKFNKAHERMTDAMTDDR